MGFTVVHENGTQDSDYREYLTLLSRQLLNQGVSLDRVPRTRANGQGERWLYVWDREPDAAAFAEQLRGQTEDPAWQVKAVRGRPSLGPLQPIEIHIGTGVNWLAFELDTLTLMALQLRFPGSCRRSTVVVRWRYPEETAPTGHDLQRLAEQVLLILTGLRAEDLAVFGSYYVIDPVSFKTVIPATPLCA